jgi:uncharacterized protein
MVHQGSGPSAPPATTILIVGGSGRALAESAAAAGWAVYAADLFNDSDLQAVATHSIDVDPREYPQALIAAAARFPVAPWCYTGAVENHPAVIDAIASCRRLAGNAGAAVNTVRDPLRLGAKARAAGLLFPETRFSPTGLPLDGSWLIKPLASASGRAIRPWTAATPPRCEEGMLWQQRVPGIPHAASLIIAPHGVRLVGLSRQLIGEPWSQGGPFAYGGSVTLSPAEVPPQLVAAATAIGHMLGEQFQLVGAVGIDLVVDADGQPWILEVNPRVTASMELHERSTGISIAAAHLEACGLARQDMAHLSRNGDGRAWAKAVLHTPASLPITNKQLAVWDATALAWAQADGGRPAIADIPTPGQTLAPRAPVLTVFASGVSADAAVATLRARVSTLAASWQPAVSLPCAAASPPPPHARNTA